MAPFSRPALAGQQRFRKLLLKAPSIWQAGDRIEPYHAIDRRFGVATFGNVLDDDDCPFALDALDRDFERALVPGFDRHDEIFVRVAKQRPRQALEFGARQDAVAHEVAQYRAHIGAGMRLFFVQAEDAQNLVVGHVELAVGVDHAKPVRHIVERRVEPGRQHGRLLPGGDFGEKVLFHPARGSLDQQEQRDEQNNDRGGIPAARNDHRGAQRNERDEDLRIDSLVERKASRQHPEGVADGCRRGDEARESIVGHPERDKRPRRQKRHISDGADNEDRLTTARRRDVRARPATRMKHHEAQPDRH